MSLLEVKKLNARIRSSNFILEDINLSIKQGESVALIGESGSGKSLLAGLLLRLFSPNSVEILGGEILFCERDILELNDCELRAIRGGEVGFVFQEPLSALNPLHTIEQQISEAISLHRNLAKSELEKEVQLLLSSVGLGMLKNRGKLYPHALSGGQRQRVMIAMALANSPKLIIADEPTTALDTSVQRQILELLFSLQKERDLALLFISHDLGVVRRYAETIYVMHQGRIIETNENRTLFNAPKHAYTKELLNALHLPPKWESKHANSKCDSSRELLVARDINVEFSTKKSWLGREIAKFSALKNISLVIKKGRNLGIVGESGSGKSTLALALTRLIKSSGEIELFGKRIDSMNECEFRAMRSKIQIVFQDPFASLSPRMSVGEILREGLCVHFNGEESSFNARILDALISVGLGEEFISRYPNELSGGQRQRISIARALILRPEILILDEPTSALDRSMEAQVVELLLELMQRFSLTYICISHDWRVICALCDDVAVLRGGEMIEYGELKSTIANPNHAYTRELLEART
ncbi:MAG: dipeptide ABC transporter ATP-binding protein [Wolinella sp.]